ncbi:hypothetical protein [Microcoleus sp. bin38.metabat.b11b12b14.051]|uniref:hypothetical protein n=1 Tax=Microcoleus sp. bin38.metabat.b11b12b14.051 TaxID=2742709 RepID=UPI0025ED8BFB|nr:hypothetical protein [Microcoleus sp. bin38.metabat.b11b12b14.051]
MNYKTTKLLIYEQERFILTAEGAEVAEKKNGEISDIKSVDIGIIYLYLFFSSAASVVSAVKNSNFSAPNLSPNSSCASRLSKSSVGCVALKNICIKINFSSGDAPYTIVE